MAEGIINDYREIFPDAPVMTDELRIDLGRRYLAQYIFYKRNKAHVDCYCTSCMQQFRIHYANMSSSEYYAEKNLAHNNPLKCPKCGALATAKSAGIKRGKLWDDKYVCRLFPTDSGNTLYILCGEIYSNFIRTPLSIEETAEQYTGANWYPHYVIRLCRNSVEACQQYWYSGWRERHNDKLFEPYIKKSMYSGSCYFTIDNPNAVKETFLRYSVNMERLTSTKYNESFLKRIKYLMFLSEYPAVEMIDKIGGKNILNRIIDYDEAYKQTLDLSGKTAAEVFHTDSNTAARIRQLMPSGKITLAVLKCFRRLKTAKIEDAIDVSNITLDMNIDYRRAAKVIKITDLTAKKFSNYLYKQAEKKLCCVTAVWQSYSDYINECETLGYDLKDPQINRPRDIDEAHGRTMSAVRAVEEERMSKEQKKKLKTYRDGIYRNYVKRYEYSDGEFSIIVPDSAEEIVAEGKKMHHCVAGYAERHINGKLCILFLRKTAAPHSSLYTIEMHGNKLTQIQGYANRTPLTPEAREFFNKWLKWQAQPECKKHPKKKKQEKVSA